MTERGHSSYSVHHDAPTHSVLATRKQINGRDTVQLKPGDESSRTIISMAVREGLLIPTGPGTYADAQGGSQ